MAMSVCLLVFAAFRLSLAHHTVVVFVQQPAASCTTREAGTDLIPDMCTMESSQAREMWLKSSPLKLSRTHWLSFPDPALLEPPLTLRRRVEFVKYATKQHDAESMRDTSSTPFVEEDFYKDNIFSKYCSPSSANSHISDDNWISQNRRADLERTVFWCGV